MSQKDAVYNAIVAVVGSVDPAVKLELTKEQRSQVVEAIATGFADKSVPLDEASYEKHQANFKPYASSVVGNWLKKDKRLTGGEPYKPENPGVRSGANDPQIKSLKGILSTLEDGDPRVELVEAEIEKRKAAIKASKENKTTLADVDISSLSPELQELFAADQRAAQEAQQAEPEPEATTEPVYDPVLDTVDPDAYDDGSDPQPELDQPQQ